MFVCESVRNIKAVLNPENSVFTKHTLVIWYVLINREEGMALNVPTGLICVIELCYTRA